jgi:large subunit ribosomal protein L23
LQQKRQNAMLESSVVGIDDKVLATELKIFEKYTQNKDKSLDELAVEMDQTYDTAHLKKIIEKWETHQKRLDNVNQHEAYMKEKMEALADEGIDTSFQETPTDAKRSLEDSYYPELFGDEALEDEKKKSEDEMAKMKEQVDSLTKAVEGNKKMEELLTKLSSEKDPKEFLKVLNEIKELTKVKPAEEDSNVKVAKLNTLHMALKTKKVGKFSGNKRNYKKIILTLKPDYKLNNIFEAVIFVNLLFITPSKTKSIVPLASCLLLILMPFRTNPQCPFY